ncbi:MAG TPA: NADH-quinone oxidoreductase subunit L [Chthonomonadaceae bacterium]|nr:NADH-quinone oxidoreductase subunit L [Chthonomonadaceae bacterium]
MQNVPSLIILLPLAGFLFNALLGRRVGPRVVSIVAPGVVLAAFCVALWTLVRIMLPAQAHAVADGKEFHGVIAPFLPFTSPDTPWIDVGGFRVEFALLIDPLSMLMALIVTGIGGLIHIYATGYMAADREQPRFFTYFNLFIFMMLLLVLGDNFLLMFVGWEGVGTCSYLLISFWYKSVENSKAGNKAFIVNRVGDIGFALGMIAIWSVFGTLTFVAPEAVGSGLAGHPRHLLANGQFAPMQGVMDLARQHIAGNGQPLSSLPHLFAIPGWFAGGTMLGAICLLLFIGAMGKSAQIPLWVWLPDAMAGPTPVSALIHAATMVTAGVVMLTRCSWLFVQAPHVMQFVALIGIATAFMGATIGMVQNDIKKVLAFSTVSQLGYMFLACGVGNFTAGMFNVTTHACFKALLFLGAGAVIHSMLGEQDMRRMGGLAAKIQRTRWVMLFGTYAIAGFPFLSGFWSKDAILDSALRSPWGGGLALYGVGLVTALMTAYYMNRLMWKTFYTDPRFVDGELAEHHHSNEDDHDHAPAAGDSHDAHGAAPTAVAHADDAGAEPAAAHGHGTGRVHESPPSMMIPLYILALLSIGLGFAVGPTHLFEEFLKPSVAPLSLGGHEELADMLPKVAGYSLGYFLSAAIAIAGLAAAAYLYGQHRKTGSLQTDAAKEANPIYRFVSAGWCFDWVYNLVFIRFGGWLADRVLWRIIDVKMIDDTVTGMASAIDVASARIRRLQTGYVRNYALAMLVGVIALVVGVFFLWIRQTR